jgi:hypothetical protein
MLGSNDKLNAIALTGSWPPKSHPPSLHKPIGAGEGHFHAANQKA